MSTDSPLSTLIIDTASDPDFTVIALHGIGADGHQFEGLLPFLSLPRDCRVRFLLPHAPAMPVTCNGGVIMPAWYDIRSLSLTHREVDLASLLRSREAIGALIEAERCRGVPSGRIVLWGYSQGGAMAYATALTYPEPLGGLLAMSTYLPAEPWLLKDLHPANRSLRILATHGDLDEVVGPVLGERARDSLRERGYSVEWHHYPMGHDMIQAELREAGHWLSGILRTA